MISRYSKTTFTLILFCIASVGFSQQADIEDNIVIFQNFKVESDALEDLIAAFDDDKALSSEQIQVLYGAEALANMNQWFQKEADFSYASLEDLEIIPQRYYAFDRYSAFVYVVTPESGESFSGDRFCYRFIVNNTWVQEYHALKGKDMGATIHDYNQISSFYDEEVALQQVIKQTSPGLLYYINKQIDVPVFSRLVTDITTNIDIDETGNISSKKQKPSVQTFFGTEPGFEDELQSNGNGDPYIKTILTDTDIEYEKQVSLVDFIVARQLELLDEVKPNTSFLKIEGSNIWVRSSPSDGEVVMKLNEGDLCLVIEKGGLQEIREMKDYWYRINFKGEEGWVYGAQTSLKLTATTVETNSQESNNEAPVLVEEPSVEEEPTDPVADIIFPIAFAVISLGFLYGFISVAQAMFRRFKKSNEETKDISEYLDDHEMEAGIRNQMEVIINRLDLERIPYLEKAKRVFPVSFRNCMVILYAIFLGLSIYTNTEEGEPIGTITYIFPLIPTLILALILSGFYTLLRKGTIWLKFSNRFKESLIQPIISLINPDLKHEIEGISVEEYRESDLFRLYRYHFHSTDKIHGKLKNGSIFSFCEIDQTSRYHIPAHKKEKERVVERSTNYTCFKGLFLILNFDVNHTEKVVKVLFHEKAKMSLIREEEFSVGVYLPEKYYNPELNRLDPNHKINTELLGGKFHVFAENSEDAQVVLNKKFEKILDYIGNKYGHQNVSISFHGNKLYLALELDKNLFETETLLSKSLKETDVVPRIYKDFMFVDQLSKELGLFSI